VIHHWPLVFMSNFRRRHACFRAKWLCQIWKKVFCDLV
jgi:hypothetical protein